MQCSWQQKERRCGYAMHVTCAQRENLAMVILTEEYTKGKPPALQIFCPEHEPVRTGRAASDPQKHEDGRASSKRGWQGTRTGPAAN